MEVEEVTVTTSVAITTPVAACKEVDEVMLIRDSELLDPVVVLMVLSDAVVDGWLCVGEILNLLECDRVVDAVLTMFTDGIIRLSLSAQDSAQRFRLTFGSTLAQLTKLAASLVEGSLRAITGVDASLRLACEVITMLEANPVRDKRVKRVR